jgi:hypothetical protein
MDTDLPTTPANDDEPASGSHVLAMDEDQEADDIVSPKQPA